MEGVLGPSHLLLWLHHDVCPNPTGTWPRDTDSISDTRNLSSKVFSSVVCDSDRKLEQGGPQEFLNLRVCVYRYSDIS